MPDLTIITGDYVPRKEGSIGTILVDAVAELILPLAPPCAACRS